MSRTQWPGESEKLGGISKRKCSLSGKDCSCPHVEAELYQYITYEYMEKLVAG
jgi:hypothetical protein